MTITASKQASAVAPKHKVLKVAHLLSGNRVWGVENYVLNLGTAINASRFQTRIICTKHGEISRKFTAQGFDTTVIPARGYHDLAFAGKIAQSVKDEEIDILHAHMGIDSMLGTIAAQIANTPIVVSTHFDQPAYTHLSTWRKNLWMSVLSTKNKHVDHFLAVTDNVANQLIKREGVSREKISIVHPGIQPFCTSKELRRTTRQSLSISDSEVVVLAIGRLEPGKNFDLLLRAAARLKNAPIRLRILIAGEGKERKVLERRIDELGVDSVTLLGYRNDVRDLLAAADIFILPSKAEAFGIAAVEAMFAQLPCLGTRIPGLSTVIDDSKTGLLFEPDDDEAVARAIERLSAQPMIRDEMGRAGRMRALKHFTSAAMTEQIERIYERVHSQHLKVKQ